MSELILQISSTHLLCGLEDGLFCNAKEVVVALWYLEHLLSHRLSNRRAAYRERSQLIVLHKKEPSKAAIDAATERLGLGPPAAAGAAKKRSAASGPKLLPLPPQQPLILPVWNITDALVEGQQYICRGLIQLVEAVKLMRMPPAAAGAASSTAAGSTVQVAEMDASQASVWFAHRFADLALVHEPPPLRLRDWLSTLSQFQTDAARAAAVAGNGSEQHLQTVLSMASRSFSFAKEVLSRAAAEIKASMAAAATNAAGNALASPLAVHSDVVKSLLHVLVSNSLLPFTYKKTLAAAAAQGATVRLAYRWESWQGAAFHYTPIHAAKLVPFPILHLETVHNRLAAADKPAS